MGLSFLKGPTSPHVLVSSLNVLSVHVCVCARTRVCILQMSGCTFCIFSDSLTEFSGSRC